MCNNNIFTNQLQKSNQISPKVSPAPMDKLTSHGYRIGECDIQHPHMISFLIKNKTFIKNNINMATPHKKKKKTKSPTCKMII